LFIVSEKISVSKFSLFAGGRAVPPAFKKYVAKINAHARFSACGKLLHQCYKLVFSIR